MRFYLGMAFAFMCVTGETVIAQGTEACGVVAYTSDGAFGTAFGYQNCDEAERLAIAECERRATDKPDCSRGAVIRRDTWFHIQFCRADEEWTTRVTTGESLDSVMQKSDEWATNSKYGRSKCRLLANGLFHSSGKHR